MDLSDPHTFDLFLRVYGTLPRAGPGGTEHTLKALAMVPGPPPRRVLDLGCGPGAQTLVLAEVLPDAEILALDIIPSMVEETRRRLSQAGYGARVRAELGDMASPSVEARSQDLIWCEGAIYFMGVQAALEIWRPLLADGGAVAFTESIWLSPEPPEEIRDWWHAQYPAITDEPGVRAAVDAAAFETVASFRLPANAWWDDYYHPMQARIEALRNDFPGDPAAEDVAAGAETEVAMFRRYSDHYSYGFFVVTPRS
jgi:serine/threonine-protein kinase HipA